MVVCFSLTLFRHIHEDRIDGQLHFSQGCGFPKELGKERNNQRCMRGNDNNLLCDSNLVKRGVKPIRE